MADETTTTQDTPPQSDAPALDPSFLKELGIAPPSSDVRPPMQNAQPAFNPTDADLLTSPGVTSKTKLPPDANKNVDAGKPPAKDPVQDPTPDPAVEEDVVSKALKGRRRADRDYTGLDDNEKKDFEQMSGSAYDRLYPLYLDYKKNKERIAKLPDMEKELAELKQKTATPPSYYDHPESYILDQRYRDGLIRQNDIQDKAEYYERQLALVEAGKPAKILQQDAKGNLVESQAYAAGPELKVYLQRMLNNTQIEYAQHTAGLGALKEQIRSSHQSYKTKLDQLFDKIYGKQKDLLAKPAEEEMSRFDESLRSHPGTNLIAYTLALLRLITKDTATTQQTPANKAAAELNEKLKKVVGPSAGEITAGAANGKPNPFKYDPAEMKRLKAEGLIP